MGYASIGYPSDSPLMVWHQQEVSSENPWLKLTPLTQSFWNRRRTFQSSLRLHYSGKPGSLAESR